MCTCVICILHAYIDTEECAALGETGDTVTTNSCYVQCGLQWNLLNVSWYR